LLRGRIVKGAGKRGLPKLILIPSPMRRGIGRGLVDEKQNEERD